MYYAPSWDLLDHGYMWFRLQISMIKLGSILYLKSPALMSNTYIIPHLYSFIFVYLKREFTLLTKWCYFIYATKLPHFLTLIIMNNLWTLCTNQWRVQRVYQQITVTSICNSKKKKKNSFCPENSGANLINSQERIVLCLILSAIMSATIFFYNKHWRVRIDCWRKTFWYKIVCFF